jgi:UDP-GlcNAc3NAcA epimerase
MKIITIVGARPQFIKAAAISRLIKDDYSTLIEEIIIHTGQHYDKNMSEVFFNEMKIPNPKYNLQISGGSHGDMTGKMIASIELVLLQENPDLVLVYGDTNSTLAGALAAVKIHIPIAHVEAGLRSFNKKMPEEVNRILVDRISDLLYCPTETAVNNLATEGIHKGVKNVGDVMYDIALYYQNHAMLKSLIHKKLNLEEKNYILSTCHRAENTNDPYRMKEILSALSQIAVNMHVIMPLHPRTRKLVFEYGLNHYLNNLTVIEPLQFLDMIALVQSASLIITDSGGIQKEAYFYKVPCITLRNETEWVETVKLGWNKLVCASKDNIINEANMMINYKKNSEISEFPYGNGEAARIIINNLIESIN